MASSSELRPCYSSSSLQRIFNASKPAKSPPSRKLVCANVWSHPLTDLTDHDTKFDVEAETALYPLGLGHSSSGSKFGMNGGQAHTDYNGNLVQSPVVVDVDGHLSAGENEEEQRPPFNQMDAPASTSEAIVRQFVLDFPASGVLVLPASLVATDLPCVLVSDVESRQGPQMFRLVLTVPVNHMVVPPSTSEATNPPFVLVLSPSGVESPQTSDIGQGPQILRLALDALGAIGTEEITKLSLNAIFQMTACLVGYYIYSISGSSSADRGSSSAAQLSKPLFYSVAVVNTVGFLTSSIGIAIRNTQLLRKTGSILGGAGFIFAAASFFLVMSTFIP